MHAAILTAATAGIDLCVEVTALQQTSDPGQPAQWSVDAWATGGDVPDVVIGLQASPAGAGVPEFSFGCGGSDGTSTCNLGTVDAGSAQRQLQAQLAVPLAATVSAVSLTATGSASGLLTGPEATAPVAVLASTAPIGVGTLPVGGSAPGATASGATVFPTLNASVPATISAGGSRTASTSALPTGNAHAAVEVVGVVALVAAFVLAVTRVSVRRPPGTGRGAATPTGRRPRGRGEAPSEGADGAE